MGHLLEGTYRIKVVAVAKVSSREIVEDPSMLSPSALDDQSVAKWKQKMKSTQVFLHTFLLVSKFDGLTVQSLRSDRRANRSASVAWACAGTHTRTYVRTYVCTYVRAHAQPNVHTHVCKHQFDCTCLCMPSHSGRIGTTDICR